MQKELYHITWWTYVTIVLSGALYLADVGSDLLLAIKYLFGDPKHMEIGYIILAILIISSIICNLKRKFATLQMFKHNFSFWLWIGPYFLLNMEPLAQLKINWNQAVQYKKCKDSGDQAGQLVAYEEFVQGHRRALWLKRNEALWEAIPQLFLQTILIVLNEILGSIFITFSWMQWLAISTSFIGLIVTNYTYYKYSFLPRSERMSEIGATLMSLGYVVPLVCRIYTNYIC